MDRVVWGWLIVFLLICTAAESAELNSHLTFHNAVSRDVCIYAYASEDYDRINRAINSVYWNRPSDELINWLELNHIKVTVECHIEENGGYPASHKPSE